MIANERSTDGTQPDRVDRVRSLFDHRENYLDKRQLDIRLRTETVGKLLEGKTFVDMLDIGCGDGSISAPLLTASRHLTLLDISTAMLSLARSRVPDELASRVTVVNQDFMQAKFKKNAFDLIICLGVLAHVASPAEVIAEVVSVLKPGGTLILECTDAYHPMGRINRMYNHIAWLVHPPKYKVNVLSAKEIRKIAEKQGLRATAVFRYSLPLPGMSRVLSPARVDRLTRRIFGDVTHNHNAWMGNQFIYCFTRP